VIAQIVAKLPHKAGNIAHRHREIRAAFNGLRQ